MSDVDAQPTDQLGRIELVKSTDERLRCAWCTNDPLYLRYHDEEWGVPHYDDILLFEMLVLEMMQAGLSFLTVLKKRERFREVFEGFDPERIAMFTGDKVEQLMSDEGIIRNRKKILATIENAKLYREIQQSMGGFSNYLWSFTGARVISRRADQEGMVPSRTELSDRLSQDLKKRGFTFVGSTICYAYLQATGVVMDHTAHCFRACELGSISSAQ
ncbi:DNA-3-methyladenine glycosylase I [Ferroacidibacillus organovorans]|uniref:DNA-3-methyladenine glycosylase I n=1 Tax=Ferroacidibacillus organovorans TaxID=1765683 RepID=UPI001365F2FE|nr:DNA-3-methyladenine glycosylase I [Ferroacidibacillus organovorans]